MQATNVTTVQITHTVVGTLSHDGTPAKHYFIAAFTRGGDAVTATCRHLETR
ncbi:MAG: hypothetical protein ACJ796_23885 [Gemmatimonadaceae bacterium]